MKKAYIVTFEVSTRVVIDSDSKGVDFKGDFGKAVEKAISNVVPRADEYIIEDNAKIYWDADCPAGTFEGDGVQEATHFYSKMQELSKSIIDETRTLMENEMAYSVEFPKASDTDTDWSEKLTIDVTEDFSGNVSTFVVERVEIKDGILQAVVVDPDFCDEEMELACEGLSIESLVSIHSFVCSKIGAIQKA